MEDETPWAAAGDGRGPALDARSEEARPAADDIWLMTPSTLRIMAFSRLSKFADGFANRLSVARPRDRTIAEWTSAMASFSGILALIASTNLFRRPWICLLTSGCSRPAGEALFPSGVGVLRSWAMHRSAMLFMPL